MDSGFEGARVPFLYSLSQRISSRIVASELRTIPKTIHSSLSVSSEVTRSGALSDLGSVLGLLGLPSGR